MNIEVAAPAARRTPARASWPWVSRWSSAEGGPQSPPGCGPCRWPAPTALDPEWCTRHGFSGKVGQTITVPDRRHGGSTRRTLTIVLVGCGRAGAGRVTGGSSRCAGPRPPSCVPWAGATRPPVLLPPGPICRPGPSGAAVAEGAVAGRLPLRHLPHRERDPERLGDAGRRGRQPRMPTSKVSPRARPGLPGGRVGQPGPRPGQRASQLAHPAEVRRHVRAPVRRRARRDVEVWDEDRIAAERLGGLLGVARGSAQPPRLVRARLRARRPRRGRRPGARTWPWWARASPSTPGGLSLKTAGGMETMKTDMGGAAAVLGAVGRGRRPRGPGPDHRLHPA